MCSDAAASRRILAVDRRHELRRHQVVAAGGTAGPERAPLLLEPPDDPPRRVLRDPQPARHVVQIERGPPRGRHDFLDHGPSDLRVDAVGRPFEHEIEVRFEDAVQAAGGGVVLLFELPVRGDGSTELEDDDGNQLDADAVGCEQRLQIGRERATEGLAQAESRAGPTADGASAPLDRRRAAESAAPRREAVERRRSTRTDG